MWHRAAKCTYSFAYEHMLGHKTEFEAATGQPYVRGRSVLAIVNTQAAWLG